MLLPEINKHYERVGFYKYKCKKCGQVVDDFHLEEHWEQHFPSPEIWGYPFKPKDYPDGYFLPDKGIIVLVRYDRKTGQPKVFTKKVEVHQELPPPRVAYEKHGRGYMVFTKNGVYVLDTYSDVSPIEQHGHFWGVAGNPSVPTWEKVSELQKLPRKIAKKVVEKLER